LFIPFIDLYVSFMISLITWIAEWVVEVIATAIARWVTEMLVEWVASAVQQVIAEWVTAIVTEIFVLFRDIIPLKGLYTNH
jgi:uncharacterized protein YggT (Ycf19 family)